MPLHISDLWKTVHIFTDFCKYLLLMKQVEKAACRELALLPILLRIITTQIYSKENLDFIMTSK